MNAQKRVAADGLNGNLRITQTTSGDDLLRVVESL
jgi:hypothetical protein